jgi:hypothetical protein
MSASISLSALIVIAGSIVHSFRSSISLPLIVIFVLLAILPVMTLSVGSGIYTSVFVVFLNSSIAPLSATFCILKSLVAHRFMFATSGRRITN